MATTGQPSVTHSELPSRKKLFSLLTTEWVQKAGYDRVNLSSVHYADSILKLLSSVSFEQHLKWNDPSVSCSPEGEIELEWNVGEKSLTIFVRNETVEVLKAWGADMDSEMDHTPLNTSISIVTEYEWLIST